MLKRCLLAATVAVGLLAAIGLPANAAANERTITSFYNNPQHTRLVGQKIVGCGDPVGGWGSVTEFRVIAHQPC